MRSPNVAEAMARFSQAPMGREVGWDVCGSFIGLARTAVTDGIKASVCGVAVG